MWKFLHGYVILQVEGLNFARFLRRALAGGVRVFRVRRTDETTATLAVPVSDFRRLRPIRRCERCRIHILSRHGMPFLWKRVRKRPVLLYGAPLCVLALWIALSRVWIIRIEGAVRTDRSEVLTLLETHGISVGKRPKGSVLILAADDLSARLPEAARVLLHRDGVLLTVEVQESEPQHDLVDWSIPAHIVAKKDAVVVSVETKRGQTAVQAGQAVKRGDVLISGHVVYAPDKTDYDTHADGTVTGACLYTAEAQLPTSVVEFAPTGQTQSVRTVALCGLRLWESRQRFETYRDISTRTVSVSLFGLPITMQVTETEELTERERILTEGERREQAELYAVNDAIALVPTDAKICSIHTVEQSADGAVRIRCSIVTEESIGITKEYANE